MSAVRCGLIEGTAYCAGAYALLERGTHPVRVWAVLDEVVLRRRVGDASVMHEELVAAAAADAACRNRDRQHSAS
jgi:hypothetical protein